MKQMNQSQTPDNAYEDIGELCVELEHQNERLSNEVARLREAYLASVERDDFLTQENARLREVCEWAADMMDGISPARGQEIRDASEKLHNQ